MSYDLRLAVKVEGCGKMVDLAEDVIRCKDCIYVSLCSTAAHGGDRMGYCNLYKDYCKENDFCNYAERVEEVGRGRIKREDYEF